MRDAAQHSLEATASTRARISTSQIGCGKVSESAINPNFMVARDGYHIRVAYSLDVYRSQIGQLVERMYSWRGLQTQNREFSARPGQTTLVAFSGEHLFGTLTLGVDTGRGLLADTLYRDQIDAVRAEGGRVCEVTRLAIDPAFSSHDVLATIFHLVFILSRRVHDMTDLFIEVNPRHVGFYQRMLQCHIAGPELTCPRVGAPAVLMHLPLEHAAHMIRKYGGHAAEAGRTLYRMFFSIEEEAHLLGRMLDTAIAA